MSVIGRPRVRAVLLVLTVAGLATIAIPEAQAVFPGRPGKIAFNADGNIFSILPSGTGLRQLTFDGHSMNPRWSADGKRIAFNRRGNIFVMWGNGTDVRRITTFGRSYQPAWSPSGRKIVFVHQTEKQGPGDLWVVRVRGGTPMRLTSDAVGHCGGNSHPVWSPLGGRIAYEQGNLLTEGCGEDQLGPHVVILRLKTGATHVIPYAQDPDFTADGRGVFFASAWDPGEAAFLPWLNLSWSGIAGTGRTMLTEYLCAEGDSCLMEGVGAPDSAYPSNPSFAYTIVPSRGGSGCLQTSQGTGFCEDGRPFPTRIDWQPVP